MLNRIKRIPKKVISRLLSKISRLFFQKVHRKDSRLNDKYSVSTAKIKQHDLAVQIPIAKVVCHVYFRSTIFSLFDFVLVCVFFYKDL